jgi:hypothetical protein
MAKFVTIQIQKSPVSPVENVGRKEVRVARKMMEEAIADLNAKGVTLAIATDKLIVTSAGHRIALV